MVIPSSFALPILHDLYCCLSALPSMLSANATFVCLFVGSGVFGVGDRDSRGVGNSSSGASGSHTIALTSFKSYRERLWYCCGRPVRLTGRLAADASSRREENSGSGDTGLSLLNAD